MSTLGSVTQLLYECSLGNKTALDALTPIVYNELRKIAASQLRRERSDHTLSPTALIHEAYLRLIEQDQPQWQSRSHFCGVAGYLMRQILVQHARARNAAKRGGGLKVTLKEALAQSPDAGFEVIALNDALEALAKLDERKARIVELRYFGGLSVEEIAQALDISVATVGREMRYAQAWLARELGAH